jgi:uncharacterized membrane protein
VALIFTLVLGTVGARVVGWVGVDYVDTWPEAIAVGLAAMFMFAGIGHVANPSRRDMVAVVPPRLPAPALLVTITGILELAGALGLLIPATRIAAAICLSLLMLAMFPANINAVRMPNPPKSMNVALPRRIAEQIVFQAAAITAVAGGLVVI